MAGVDYSFLSGGNGMRNAAPGNANAAVVGASQGHAHIGVVGLVLFAVVILLILDNLGFRFAVTAGKR